MGALVCLAGIMLLVACGPSRSPEAQALMRACMAEETSSKASCTCVVDRLETQLTSDDVAITAKAFAGSESDFESILGALPEARRVTILSTLTEAAVACRD